MKSIFAAALFFAAVLFLTPSAHAKEHIQIIGHVVAVTDGDTLKLLTPEKQLIKIRLAEIDAPEKKQPYGMKAKKSAF